MSEQEFKRKKKADQQQSEAQLPAYGNDKELEDKYGFMFGGPSGTQGFSKTIRLDIGYYLVRARSGQ